MAELRLTGPTEDGDALRLSGPEGEEHTLALSPYLRRLVLEGGAPEAVRRSEDGPAAWHDMTEMDVAEEDAEGPVDAARHADESAEEGERAPDVPSGPTRPDEDLALTPRIDPRPAADDETADGPTPAPLTDQESIKAAATHEAEPLTPREIQQRIRAGASVEQVARESGNAFSRIRTYGHPVLAERDWIARQARAVEVWVGGPDLYADLVQDGGPTTLGELAAHRLAELGVDEASLEWDAWREHQAGWTVAARFAVAGAAGLPTREEPPALWTFRPAGRHLEPENAWARALSEAEAWDLVPRAPAAEPATDDADTEDAVTPAGAHSPAADRDADLLEILRVRRGQRVGADLESDDALAHLIAREHQDRSQREAAQAPERLAPVDAEGALTTADDVPGVDEPEPAAETDPAEDTASVVEDAGVEDEGAEPARRERGARPAMPTVTPRPRARSAARRASVPSWDEIVFGRKGD
ncbi:septation protein SepH [Micrococcus luteus]|uniref:septation protein SepH n=1 Tax=Micrococcus luteus TaxID=1270 RepID=UPI0037CC52A0